MLDASQNIYYVSYGIITVFIGLAYFKIKSTEGIIITTQEFKIFQSGFLTGYGLMILGELLSTACFFHTCLYFKLTILQITKLYIISICSTTVTNILNEIVEIGSHKSKCQTSAILYTLSSVIMLFGRWDPYHMMMISRVLFGSGSALHHASFDSYVINEHSSNGFPDDWLSYTFTLLSHYMALIAVLSGVLGQTVAGTQSPLNAVTVCCLLFSAAGVYIHVVWSQDATYTGNKFNMTALITNTNTAIRTIQSNKSILFLMLITVCCESAILVFTFYWALWLYFMTKIENNHLIPFELIFSCFITSSMLGNYLYQLSSSSTSGSSYSYSSESLFQTVLIVSSGAFILGSVSLTPSMAFFAAVSIYLCMGCYWPSIGLLRGKLVMPELRSSFITICRVLTCLLSATVLTVIHFNSFLTLTMCGMLFGLATYLHNLLNNDHIGKLGQQQVHDDNHEDEEEDNT